VAEEIGGVAVTVDVADESQVQNLVQTALARYGEIDLFCSNAGIVGGVGGAEVANERWQRSWEVNVMGHIYAARAVLPAMIERGGGYLLHTASAAGLLSTLGTAPYTVTKHAAVAFAEWLSISHAHQGIKVSCLCPQGVLTDMLKGDLLTPGALTPEAVAASVIEGLDAERFLILPHPEVRQYFQNRSNDHERWLGGMRKLHDKFVRDKNPWS
jgi:NAD(P)-dependent dehydrogenase (short-subunit alcohol dehydrogenase family)